MDLKKYTSTKYSNKTTGKGGFSSFRQGREWVHHQHWSCRGKLMKSNICAGFVFNKFVVFFDVGDAKYWWRPIAWWGKSKFCSFFFFHCFRNLPTTRQRVSFSAVCLSSFLTDPGPIIIFISSFEWPDHGWLGYLIKR